LSEIGHYYLSLTISATGFDNLTDFSYNQSVCYPEKKKGPI